MLITNVIIVNEGESRRGSLLVRDGLIFQISYSEDLTPEPGEEVVDGHGGYLLPGVIDDHVHFRDPGLTHKADMNTESMAAAAGGVTSVMDMPNVNPQTTTLQHWQERMELAHDRMHVNYAFHLGATNDNLDEIRKMDITRIPSVKLFMGSSTGNMLVDRKEVLLDIFRESPTLIMAHCEDTARINQRMSLYQEKYGEDPNVKFHPEIRDEEACYQSSLLACQMAHQTGARLHIAHITTARELELLGGNITGEACVAHLLYSDQDYERLGTMIKCNPAIKTQQDRDALRNALNDDRISVIGTDHAPHLISEKAGGARSAVSGMPMVQFSLVSMLEMVDQGILTIERMVRLMCHNPAKLFHVNKRGFIRQGYKADLVLVRRTEGYTIQKQDILSLCGWSPRLGDTLHWSINSTWVNGQQVWDGKSVNTGIVGEALTFDY